VEADVSTWAVLLALFGLLSGLAAALTGLIALNRVLRPLLQIERYAQDTLDAGLGIARNLEAIDEARRTRELVTALARAVGPAP
jgi:hypothetical protein